MFKEKEMGRVSDYKYVGVMVSEDGGWKKAARRVIEKAGAMEKAGRLWVQRAGINMDETVQVMQTSTEHGNIPEPLRTAHMIAGGVVDGESRGRA